MNGQTLFTLYVLFGGYAASVVTLVAGLLVWLSNRRKEGSAWAYESIWLATLHVFYATAGFLAPPFTHDFLLWASATIALSVLLIWQGLQSLKLLMGHSSDEARRAFEWFRLVAFGARFLSIFAVVFFGWVFSLAIGKDTGINVWQVWAIECCVAAVVFPAIVLWMYRSHRKNQSSQSPR